MIAIVFCFLTLGGDSAKLTLLFAIKKDQERVTTIEIVERAKTI